MSIDQPGAPSDDREDRLVDPRLAADWQAHSCEQPPPGLDAAILTAAHREAGAGPRDPRLAEAREPERWWWPLAAAAVIGAIAFGVIELLPPGRGVDETVVSDTPSRKATSAARHAEPVAVPMSPLPGAPSEAPTVVPGSDAQAPRSPSVRERAAVPDTPRASSEPDVPSRSRVPTVSSAGDRTQAPPLALPAPEPQSALPAPPPFPGGTSAPDAAAGAASAEQRDAHPAQAAISAKSTYESAAPVPAPPSSPDQWIERIGVLRREGRDREAEAALNAFRAAYADADARLPEELRAWAAKVQRRAGHP